MKKTLLLAGVAGALFSLNANAMDLTPYVGARVLYTSIDAKMKYSDATDSEKYNIDDKGIGAGLFVGSAIKLPYGAIRAELEYNKKADTKKSYTTNIGLPETFNAKLETQSFMLNAYYDIDTGSKITPYIGGGIGYAKLKLNDQYWQDVYAKNIKDTNFAWQIGAGVAYAVTDNISIDAGYRYIDFGDLSDSGDDGYGGESEKIDVSANEFYLGVRYNF